MEFPEKKSNSEWARQLTPFEYAVLREAATEAPFSGDLLDEERAGQYSCKACGHPLFESETKFEAHCGWPSFYETLEDDSVVLSEDRSIPGRPRTEVRCANCGSHLGHVFDDAPETPTGDRYCMNSVALQFKPE
ncbi:MAG: peptide-methionine (R)-S-oxide reductase MsrB [Microbacteriaceae bacterium]|nr:peptide-methionine (R)-S-oxide reductase MsrB [Microbacteriaceae bacterium]